MNSTEEKILENEQTISNERISNINFKMVTFSLNNRDYAINIMKVKEIAKAKNFTIIPNAANFILGVHNLRGEIIPIIDLRKMFGIKIEKSEPDQLENVIFLRFEDNLIGVIVDKINKVVGIDSRIIKPPHPLFNDINVHYIKGIVEHLERLYILLDVERMLGKEEEAVSVTGIMKNEEKTREKEALVKNGKDAIEFNFVVETLETFSHFILSKNNHKWVKERYKTWKKIRKELGINTQLSNIEDAENFLQTFYSPFTGKLWNHEYSEKISSVLPDTGSNIIKVWNPGCAKGYETYSFACLLKEKNMESNIKIWANDNDLLNISLAPNIILFESEVMKKYIELGFIIKSNNEYQYSKIIKDSIIFEYHDILHRNQYPPVDIILCRDLISFLSPEKQIKVLNDFNDKLKDHGILITGKNEIIEMDGFIRISEGDVLAFRKEKT